MSAKATPPGAPPQARPLTQSTLPPRRLAALLAACLMIDDAYLYGLIDSAPKIDRERCRELLAQLRREGVVAEQDEISEAALELMAEIGMVRA